MTDARVVLVVPCYMEEARLVPRAFLEFLPSRPWLSLLFVDDGSPDGTGAVLASMAASCPGQVRVVALARNSGKAEAVRTGVLEAARSRPDYVGFWDADLATPLEAVDDFLAVARLRPDVEMIIGARVNLMGRVIRRTSSRHYISRVFATAASLALGLPVYDTQCGAKLFRATDEVMSLFAEPFTSRWIFDIEILERYMRLPARDGGPIRRACIYEVVLREWTAVPGSKLRARDFLWSFVEAFNVWRRRVSQGRGVAPVCVNPRPPVPFTAAGEQESGESKG